MPIKKIMIPKLFLKMPEEIHSEKRLKTTDKVF